MKNILFAAIVGFALLFVNGVYAQNMPATPDMYSSPYVHPLDSSRYEVQPHPMRQKWPSAPTMKPGGQY